MDWRLVPAPLLWCAGTTGHEANRASHHRRGHVDQKDPRSHRGRLGAPAHMAISQARAAPCGMRAMRMPVRVLRPSLAGQPTGTGAAQAVPDFELDQRING
jgi:hypothetical protein